MPGEIVRDNQVGAPAPLRAWLAVLVLSTCYVFSLLDRLIISLLVEPMKHSLSLSDVQIGLLQGSAFAIFYATMGVPLGRLADRVNRRNLIAWSIAFWGLCTAASGLARGFVGLLAARVGVGAGEAALTPAAYSIIGDSFKGDRLGRAMGVYTVGGAIGSGIALLIGGATYRQLETLGPVMVPGIGSLEPWQATLVVVGLPGLLLALVVRLFVFEPARATMTTASNFATVLSMIRDKARFYVPVFAAYAAIGGLAYGFVSWTPAFLARAFSLGPADVGARFGPVMLVAGLLGPLVAGTAADRLHARHGVRAPFIVMKVFLALLVVASLVAFRADDVAGALLGCGVVGFLAMGLLGLPPLALQLVTPSHMRGQIAGVNLMLGNLLGLGLGPLGVALVAEHVAPDGSLAWALMWVIATLGMTGLVVSATAKLDRIPATVTNA